MKNAASEKYFCFVELAKKAEEVTKVEPIEVHTTLMTSTSELEVEQSPNSQNKIQSSTVLESTQSLFPNE